MSKVRLSLCISKSWLIYIVLFYFSIFRDYLETVIGVLQYADEAVALMAVPLFMAKLGKNDFKLKIKTGGGYNMARNIYNSRAARERNLPLPAVYWRGSS